MSKSKFYVSTRNATRADKGEVNDAISAFLSSGISQFDGDMVIGQHVMNYCIEKGIPIELTHLGRSAVLRRVRA